MEAPTGEGLRPRALILAAGVGKRMAGGQPAGPGHPKALLRFGGTSLLARHVAILHRAGIVDITVVAGFMAGLIEAELASLPAEPRVQVIVNPDFRSGSVVSLHAGAAVLRGGGPVLLMDADVIYDDRLMARLLGSARSNCLLLDRDIEPGDEPVKLCIAGGRIVDFHKRPQAAYEWHGESVGFFRFDARAAAELADRAASYVAGGRGGMEYEEPVRDMMLASEADRFGFEDISGLPWTEIDFQEDVTKAAALLPELNEALT